VLVIPKLRVLGEFNRAPVNMNDARHLGSPRLEPVKFRLQVDGALYPRDEFRELADVNAHSLTSESARFDEARAPADIRIEDQLTGLRESLNGRPGEGRRKASRVFVEPVCQTPHRFGVARGGYEPGLCAPRNSQKIEVIHSALHRLRISDSPQDAGNNKPLLSFLKFYDKHKLMDRSISAKQKKRGRPATGVRPMIGLRLSKADIARLDRWAGQHGLTRSDAIRTLIDHALKRKIVR
jgi:hypothetical protein